MRISVEWLRELADFDAPVEALVERLPGVGLGIEAIERPGEDTVLDLEVTSNRPDWMSLLGVAREVALLFDRPLRFPGGGRGSRAARAPSRPAAAGKAGAVSAGPAASERIAVTVRDARGCPRFTAAVIEGVRIGPSPIWMQRRLEACGVRAVNNVVDITNYVMLELGQPMHAFDYDRIAGRRLIVRRARAGEPLVTLDGIPRTLDEEVLVVADAERAVALAGVIGGRDTEIGPASTTVLLEAAYWDPPTIARAARRLGIRTEASARFERGADPDAGPLAQTRAASLLSEICGGRVLRGLVDVYPRRITPRAIRLRPERARAVLGVEIAGGEMRRILRALGCTVEGARTLRVRPPAFRPDLTREEDLIEEVIRIHGYDRVPLTLPGGAMTPARLAPSLRADRYVREILTRCGLTEALTLTFVDPEAAEAGGDGPAGGGTSAGGPAVALQNPLAADHSVMRVSLLPGLLYVLATNASRRVEDVHVFELGRVFRRRGAGRRPEERRSLAIALMGRWRSGWNVPEEQAVADFYHLRGILDTLLAALGVRSYTVSTKASAPGGWWQPGRAAEVTVAGCRVASFGELHRDRAAAHRLPHAAYLAEIALETLVKPVGDDPLQPLYLETTGVDLASRIASVPPIGLYAGIPRYPGVERDLAAILPQDTPASQVERLIREAAGPLLEGVELFDVYTGAPVPPGHRNVAYRLRLRAPDRTLTTAESEETMGRVRIALQTRAGAQIRE